MNTRCILAGGIMLLTALLGGACAASEVTPPPRTADTAPAAPAATPMVPAAWDDASRSPEAVAAGESLLHTVAAAYRAAPGLRDEAIIERIAAGSRSVTSMRLSMGKGTDGVLEQRARRFVAVGPDLFITADSVPEKFFHAPLQVNLNETLKRLPGGFGQPPFPHFILRHGNDADDPAAALGLGMPLGFRVAGHRASLTSGGDGHEVLLHGRAVEGVAVIDHDTHLVRQVRIRFHTPGTPDATASFMTVHYQPCVSAEPEPITFAAADRVRVDRIDQLTRLPGESMHGAVLDTPDGEAVAVEDWRGSVVVLSFWSRSCQTCVAGLARLDEFNRWALATGGGIKTFGVLSHTHVLRNELLGVASEQWERTRRTFPTLVDPDNRLATPLGIEDQRRIVVIDASGRLAATLNDTAGIVEELKRLVTGLRHSQRTP
jgi:Redoxin